jgi:SPP1 family predicted phage head-tail adaptor
MRIGELDSRITLQNYSASVEQIESYSDYRTVWAKIDFNGGSETDEFNRITAISKVKYFIRNIDLTNLSEKTRISYDSKLYYIQAINEIEGRESFLELITEQRD